MSVVQLETSSHILQLFPSSKGRPYYSLAEKSNPTGYTPQPLHLKCKLTADPIPATDESYNLAITLEDKSIGQITNDPEDIEQLAQFSFQWEDAISLLSARESPPTEPSFNPIRTVAEGLATLPKIFTSSSPSNDPLTKELPSPSTNSNPVPQLVANIQAHQNEFINEKKISIRLTSWNIHGESVQRVNLAPLLGMPKKFDVYVFALQECDPLGPTTLSSNAATLKATQDAIIATLGGPKFDKVVSSSQLIGILIILVASTEMAPHFSKLKVDSTGTGFFGLWGNKGAASIKAVIGADPSLGIKGTELAFLACHLAAGENKSAIKRRAWEFSEMVRRIGIEGLLHIDQNPDALFEDEVDDDETDALPPSPVKPSPAISFVLGDLNYRVNLDFELVRDFAKNSEFETILIHDQLSQQVKRRRVLTGFQEQVIGFPPTYKYAIGTGQFDESRQSSKDKPRVPSYTDRIFYTPSPGLWPIDYSSIMDYTISDHKPVFASFELTVPLIDQAKRKQVVEDVLKQSDIVENSLRPIVTVDPRELLVYDTRVLELAEGQILMEQEPLLPGQTDQVVEWNITVNTRDVTVSPTSGSLPVGAKQYINFSCMIPVCQENKVHAVAVLKILNGQDIFIPIEFKALPSCLGKSLLEMSKMPQGARNPSAKHSTPKSTNMPREIRNCIDYLWAHAFSDLFDAKLSVPEKSIQTQIQDWMDTGEDFDCEVLDTANKFQRNSGVYSVAQQFLVLLKYLKGGIIPMEYYSCVLTGREGAIKVICFTCRY